MIFHKKPVRKIENGKLYDTLKATKVTSYEERSIIFGRCITYTLYKGKTEWFVEGNGCIFPKNELEAKDILSRHDTDQYIKYFGEPELA